MQRLLFLLLAVLVVFPGHLHAEADMRPRDVLRGTIVSHRAFAAVLQNYPERRRADVDGYIGVNDCGEMGNLYALVRDGVPDAVVAVADCAQARHVAFRERMGYIADVDIAVWDGPEIPQEAELWPLEKRAAYWERMERLR